MLSGHSIRHPRKGETVYWCRPTLRGPSGRRRGSPTRPTPPPTQTPRERTDRDRRPSVWTDFPVNKILGLRVSRRRSPEGTEGSTEVSSSSGVSAPSSTDPLGPDRRTSCTSEPGGDGILTLPTGVPRRRWRTLVDVGSVSICVSFVPSVRDLGTVLCECDRRRLIVSGSMCECVCEEVYVCEDLCDTWVHTGGCVSACGRFRLGAPTLPLQASERSGDKGTQRGEQEVGPTPSPSPSPTVGSPVKASLQGSGPSSKEPRGPSLVSPGGPRPRSSVRPDLLREEATVELL